MPRKTPVVWELKQSVKGGEVPGKGELRDGGQGGVGGEKGRENRGRVEVETGESEVGKRVEDGRVEDDRGSPEVRENRG